MMDAVLLGEDTAAQLKKTVFVQWRKLQSKMLRMDAVIWVEDTAANLIAFALWNLLRSDYYFINKIDFKVFSSKQGKCMLLNLNLREAFSNGS